MLFYKHKNSFILPPYVRAYVQQNDVISRQNDVMHHRYSLPVPYGGILSPYARVRTHDVTPLRTYATSSTYAKTADVILAGNLSHMGDTLTVRTRTHAYARMTSFSRPITSLPTPDGGCSTTNAGVF